MNRYVSNEIRNFVASRAENVCEYCLIYEEDTFFGCEVYHIISIKNGGSTNLDNLAYACALCNRHKGSDIGSFLHETGEFIRFFNPHKDFWVDHFKLNRSFIQPLTNIGEVTARILNINDDCRILERQALIDVGRYPPIWLSDLWTL
ncbi:TPA: HNH endonuclease [bacterium]|nr:HNH endonuclease [bacterium]